MRIQRIVLTLGFVLAIAAAAGAAYAMRPANGIEIDYSPRLDAACGLLLGAPVRAAWAAELEARLPEYRALWERDGPRMLSMAEELSGLPQPRNARVHLTLCALPSRSFLGTSVNMRYALQGFTATPVPLRYKVDVQLHELLHLMLDDRVAADSPLSARLEGATSCVREHVHLLALQKAVLTRLDEHAALADVIRIDSLLPGGCYRQAWAMINATPERYLDYVAELKPVTAPRDPGAAGP
jgi:hypothetical protein